ncbi:MAG: phospholipase D-like domain-containing protein [Victivallaceae bacterium]|nr:phospholipase D-like domain-containing protein [Victivallaceae bacterium]
MTEFVSDREIYEKAVMKLVPQSRRRLWIATADIKDMYVESNGEMVPFLKLLADLLAQGVEIRLIHAKEPGPNFRQDFDRFPGLWTGLERVLCPRVHFKCIISDGAEAYFGSANLTGAGMGAKASNRRNFENGVLTDDQVMVSKLETQFDDIWRGAHCRKCGRRQFCTDCPLT